MRIAFLLLLLAASAHGAPAPLPRPRPACAKIEQPVLFRHYVWPACPGYRAYLCHGGRFVCDGPAGLEEGTWTFTAHGLEMRVLYENGASGWVWGCPAETWREHLAPAD